MGKLKIRGLYPNALLSVTLPTVSMSREQRMDHTMIGTGGHKDPGPLTFNKSSEPLLP